MDRVRPVVFFLLISLTAAVPADEISAQARKLHFPSIVLDTHDDTTERFFAGDFDPGKRNPSGHVDIPRMREGGMNAIFFSIWIDGRVTGPPAIQRPWTRSTRSTKTSNGFHRTCSSPAPLPTFAMPARREKSLRSSASKAGT